jgi:hypothetical protein
MKRKSNGNVSTENNMALRSQYDIPEASCEDMLTSIVCSPCAIAQHAREIDARMGTHQENGLQYEYLEEPNSPPEVIKVQP